MPAQNDSATIYQRPVELLQNLIRFDTTNPPGNERECVEYIAGLLRAAGIEPRFYSRVPERPSLVARIKGAGRAAPLLLYGHVDVVTTVGQNWRYPPFSGVLAEGQVWGRGTMDMKGCVAMMIAAFVRAKVEGLTPPGDVVLLVLADEENAAHYGARYLAEHNPEIFQGIRYGLGELGGFSIYVHGKRFYPIQVNEKQVCRVKATLRGPGGHGSLPMRGGAMSKLARMLLQIEGHRLPMHVTSVTRQFFEGMAAALPLPFNDMPRGLLDPSQSDAILDQLGGAGRMYDAMLHNTVNATVVRGGEKMNVIPSEIEVRFDGRLLPGFGPADFEAELREIIGQEVELELLRYDQGPQGEDMGLYETLAQTLREADPEGTPLPFLLPASTDGRHFAPLGVQTYGFMPMKLPEGLNPLQYAHAADERIPVEAVNWGTEIMYRVLQRFV